MAKSWEQQCQEADDHVTEYGTSEDALRARAAGEEPSRLGVSEFVERVADALEAVRDSINRNPLDHEPRELSRALARAAIEAMRTPSEAMIEAYCRAHERLGFTSWANASVTLDAMISAALTGRGVR